MGKIYNVEIRPTFNGKYQYRLPFSLLWSDECDDLNKLAKDILIDINNRIQKDNIYRKEHNIPEIELFSRIQFYQYNSYGIMI